MNFKNQKERIKRGQLEAIDESNHCSKQIRPGVGALPAHLTYSLFGLALGFCCIAASIILFSLGAAGDTVWSLEMFGLKFKLAGAAPGVVALVVGVIIIWVTRPARRR